MNILIFIVILLVLVVSHEFGHFIVAKKSGIRVDEFAFGMGPKIFGFKKGETTYRVNILPIGGYVKIFGENPDEDSSKLNLVKNTLNKKIDLFLSNSFGFGGTNSAIVVKKYI